MRVVQIVAFAAGAAALGSAIFFIGSGMGDTLWRAGMAILLLDVVCIQLWPLRHGDMRTGC